MSEMEIPPLDPYADDPICSDSESEEESSEEFSDTSIFATHQESECMCEGCPMYPTGIRVQKRQKNKEERKVCCQGFTKVREDLSEKGKFIYKPQLNKSHAKPQLRPQAGLSCLYYHNPCMHDPVPVTIPIPVTIPELKD